MSTDNIATSNAPGASGACMPDGSDNLTELLTRTCSVEAYTASREWYDIHNPFGNAFKPLTLV